MRGREAAAVAAYGSSRARIGRRMTPPATIAAQLLAELVAAWLEDR